MGLSRTTRYRAEQDYQLQLHNTAKSCARGAVAMAVSVHSGLLGWGWNLTFDERS